MEMMPFLLHALSPLHAGTGQGIDVIDLPIARAKATGIPFAPSSSIKGALRDALRIDQDPERLQAVFGPERQHASEHAGALVVGDARLLLLPVRSFFGTFAWVTSPLLLSLAKRDLSEAFGSDAAQRYEVPALDDFSALVSSDSKCLQRGSAGKAGADRLYLEDLDLPAQSSAQLGSWLDWLGREVARENIASFKRRFAVVDDETMTFLWETATQVDARIRLDETTRTVATGALWLEESLPAETVLLGLCGADRSRRSTMPMQPREVLDFVFRERSALQFGGKASVGRGRCRLIGLRGLGT